MRTHSALRLEIAVGFVVLAACVTAVASPLAVGADPTPTPTPRKTPIVISNENLADYAAQGRLTTTGSATSGEGKERRPVHRNAVGDPSKTVQDAVADAPELAMDERRRFWRDKYQQQVNLVGSIEEQIRILDWEIPGLWRDFYARDDPAYRDGVIKPKLDEALARSDRLEQQLKSEQEMLEKFRADARKDGAEPGWFRGIEKPTPRPRKDEGTDTPLVIQN